uniref:Uncharacterized protein n=1 Tax=Rhizophora mucronata TaxID=61149 RepID=A0A2P2NPI2_RHIMU
MTQLRLLLMMPWIMIKADQQVIRVGKPSHIRWYVSPSLKLKQDSNNNNNFPYFKKI